jgi:hypothetical protein
VPQGRLPFSIDFGATPDSVDTIVHWTSAPSAPSSSAAKARSIRLTVKQVLST